MRHGSHKECSSRMTWGSTTRLSTRGWSKSLWCRIGSGPAPWSSTTQIVRTQPGRPESVGFGRSGWALVHAVPQPGLSRRPNGDAWRRSCGGGRDECAARDGVVDASRTQSHDDNGKAAAMAAHLSRLLLLSTQEYSGLLQWENAVIKFNAAMRNHPQINNPCF